MAAITAKFLGTVPNGRDEQLERECHRLEHERERVSQATDRLGKTIRRQLEIISEFADVEELLRRGGQRR